MSITLVLYYNNSSTLRKTGQGAIFLKYHDQCKFS
jgi:hypothetical protein